MGQYIYFFKLNDFMIILGAIAAYPACQAGFAACSKVCIAMFLAPTP